MSYLEVETPDGTRRVALKGERLSIGRLAYNDIALPSAQISRQHAELRRVAGQWWIADLHSTNGVHVNERRVERHQLAPGDRILLAPGIALRFLDELAASSPNLAGQSAPQLWAVPAPSVADAAHEGVKVTLPVDMPAAPPGFGRPDRGAYPVPRGPITAGGELGDPYRRSYPAAEHRATGGPASKLLHTCQVCGQRTAPDAPLCQVCGQSIATACANCRLGLLPIQQRCPRCQTANPASVRRAQHLTGA